MHAQRTCTTPIFCANHLLREGSPWEVHFDGEIRVLRKGVIDGHKEQGCEDGGYQLLLLPSAC